MQIVEIVTKKKLEEQLQTKRDIAYLAWLQGCGGEITYLKYLEQLKLTEQQIREQLTKTKKETQQDNKKKAKQAIQKAEAIVAKMRGGR